MNIKCVLISAQLCESKGLVHLSHGEGAERQIIIQKPGAETIHPVTTTTKHSVTMTTPQYSTAQGEVCQVTQNAVEPRCTPVTIDSPHQSDVLATCPDCGNNVPAQNMQLHELWCQSKAVSSDEDVKVTKPANQKKEGRSRKKRSKKQSNQTETKVLDGDDDEVLEAAIKENKRCAFKGCKKPVVTFNMWCSYCNSKFCSEHFLAEVHGCGDAAKASARRTINREGRLYPGSGVPDKKPNALQRNQLKRKLDSKLNQLADKRKGGK